MSLAAASVNRRLSAGQPFALLLGDVDALKLINDRHGHAAGDAALKNLAAALAGALAPGDELARIGGDEFALLATIRSAADAFQLADRYEELAAGEACGVTFGWAVYPNDAVDAVSLTMTADSRLYARKADRFIDPNARGNVIQMRPFGGISFSS
jgi:diguanylate cyclase (GGDEF)-like protein